MWYSSNHRFIKRSHFRGLWQAGQSYPQRHFADEKKGIQEAHQQGRHGMDVCGTETP